MNQTIVIAEWRRAGRSLHAASLCLRHGCPADTISRDYYAAFHAAKAALILRTGSAPQSHGSVRQQFGLQLVKNGPLEGHWGREIGNLYDLRIGADYDPQQGYSAVYVREVHQRAERFLERILRYLSSGISFAELA